MTGECPQALRGEHLWLNYGAQGALGTNVLGLPFSIRVRCFVCGASNPEVPDAVQ